MNDALIAIVVIIVAVVPVVATISYAYFSVITSADISSELNTFGNSVDELIWNHMNDPVSHPLGTPPLTATTPTPTYETITLSSFAGANTIDVEVMKFIQPLKASRRNVQAEVTMIRLKP